MASWERGFTLGELLIVLAIFGTLTAVSLPHWVALLPSYRLNGAARQVQSELHRTKSRAVAENADFQLVLSTTSYKIQKKVGGAWQDTGENKPLPDGITQGSASATKLSFTPRGTSNGGTVILCNNKNTGKNIVVLSSTGRIRIVNVTC